MLEYCCEDFGCTQTLVRPGTDAGGLDHSNSSQRYWIEPHHSREHSSSAPHAGGCLYPSSPRLALGTVTLDSCAAAPECHILMTVLFYGDYTSYKDR